MTWGHAQSLPSSRNNEACFEAAQKALGPSAEVLKCGQLTGTALETVAVVPLKKFRKTADGVPVSTLVILRREAKQWVAEMKADKDWIRNDFGYLNDDLSDPTHFGHFVEGYSRQYIGYRVSFSDKSYNTSNFVVWIYILSPTGENEGISTEIGWNPSARRFQAFAYGQDP